MNPGAMPRIWPKTPPTIGVNPTFNSSPKERFQPIHADPVSFAS